MRYQYTKKFLTSLLAIGYTLLASLVFAQGTVGGTTPCEENGLPNPLCITTIAELIDRIMGALIKIAAPIAAIMIIYGAFQILTAGGNPEGFKKGKNTILYTVIGYGIILIAKGITAIIEQVLKGP